MKDSNDILLQLEELISGNRVPANRLEDLFMIGYRHALYNKAFIDKYLELAGSEMDYDNANELHALCLGYGMGQKKLEEEIAEFELNEDKQTNH